MRHVKESRITVHVLPRGHRLMYAGIPRECIVHEDEAPVRIELSGDLPAQRIADIILAETTRLIPGKSGGALVEHIHVASVPIVGSIVSETGKIVHWPISGPGSNVV